jgi:hypothetical protein
MRQGPAPMITSPCPFKPSSGTRLPQCLTDINDQESLRGLGEGKDRNIFDSHQLLIEIVVIFSALRLDKVINLGMVVCGNA